MFKKKLVNKNLISKLKMKVVRSERIFDTGIVPKLKHFWHVLGSTSQHNYPIFTVFSQNMNGVDAKRKP